MENHGYIFFLNNCAHLPHQNLEEMFNKLFSVEGLKGADTTLDPIVKQLMESLEETGEKSDKSCS